MEICILCMFMDIASIRHILFLGCKIENACLKYIEEEQSRCQTDGQKEMIRIRKMNKIGKVGKILFLIL